MYWASVATRLVVISKKSKQVLQVNPAYVGKQPILSLRVDESWSFVSGKKQPRWLWWVEDADTSQIVAFVFGRRTHQTFRRLIHLLSQAQITISRWFTDSWCRAAGAGLF